jgi:hypothetical protein
MLTQTLEGCDLSTAHTVLALFAAGLAVYVMQLTSHVQEDAVDPLWLQWARRVGLAAVALALIWSVSYSTTKMWQPWPPELALILALIGVLGVRAVAIRLRLRRDKIGQQVPHQVPTRS